VVGFAELLQGRENEQSHPTKRVDNSNMVEKAENDNNGDAICAIVVTVSFFNE
jgi:hypothetical protein